jgi:glycosyltransferase involved in cell wall biosynthesis
VSQLTVGVAITVRDGARYIAETLSSILEQTSAVDQVVVVDDGSTDPSAAIAESFGPPVRVIRTPPQGSAHGRNRAIGELNTDLIALCDADDLWLPRKVELQLAALAGSDALVASFTGVDEFVSPEVDPASLPGRGPRTGLFEVRLASSLLAPRTTFEAVGPFMGGSGAGDWVAWCVRLDSTVTATLHLPEVLVRRRLHLTNLSLQPEGRTTAWTHALARHLRTRRGEDM